MGLIYDETNEIGYNIYITTEYLSPLKWDSGDMNTTWYRHALSHLQPANAAVIPLAQNEATWSVIIDINGEVTSTIVQ